VSCPGDRADDHPADAPLEVAAEHGHGPWRAGEHDALHTQLVDQLGERGSERVEVMPTLLLDVTLIARLGQELPAALPVATVDLALERDGLARAIGQQRDEARAHAVDEDDEHLRSRLEQSGETAKVRRGGHQEEVVHARSQRQHLAEARRAAGEERDGAGLRARRGVLDERLALPLHPRQVGLELGGRAHPSPPDFVLQKDPGPLALVLVGPVGV
jgi:hypothetical protein